jgi:hypothetical protein
MRARWLLAVAAIFSSCWGGAVPQAPVCAAWVACQRARDVRDGLPAADLVRYELDGFCWNNSELAKGCTTSCERGLERIRARDTALPVECAP